MQLCVLNVHNYSNNKVFQDYIWSKYCSGTSYHLYCPLNVPKSDITSVPVLSLLLTIMTQLEPVGPGLD